MSVTSVTRKSCEQYALRVRPSEKSYTHWAFITLSEEGGILQILSDYGAWANLWPCHGRQSFRHFLIEVDTEYLVRKLTKEKREFDLAATLQRINDIIEEKCGDTERTVIARSHLEEIETRHGHSADLFCYHFLQYPSLDCLHSEAFSGDLCVYRSDGACTEFANRLWPVFVAELKKELGGGI